MDHLIYNLLKSLLLFVNICLIEHLVDLNFNTINLCFDKNEESLSLSL